MKCKVCYEEIRADDIFCPNCGARIEITEREDRRIHDQKLIKDKKGSRQKLLIGTLSVVFIMTAIGIVIFKNKDDQAPDETQMPSDQEEVELQHSDYPGKDLLKEGFYMNYETELDSLLGEVVIHSWKVSLLDSDTILFEITYETDTEYQVVCFNQGDGESYSTLYNGEGLKTIYPDETILKFRIPKKAYLNTLTDGFSIVISSDMNIGSGESGSIHTVGKRSAVSEESSNAYTEEEARSYLENTVLVNESGYVLDTEDAAETDEYLFHVYYLTDEGNGYAHTATIGWYCVNKYSLEITDFMSGEKIAI